MIENTISINDVHTAEGEAEYGGIGLNIAEKQHTEAVVQQKTAQEDFFGFFEEACTAQGEASADAETTADAEDFLTLNVYGKTVDVPYGEAVAAAQRGLAFDEMKTRLAAVKNDARIKAMENLAQFKGQSLPQLITQLNMDAVTESLLEQYGDFSLVPQKELAMAVQTMQQLENSTQLAAQQWQIEDKKNQLAEFLDNNPGCTEIPDEVISLVKKGKNLSLAYAQCKAQQFFRELEEAKKELSVLKSNKKAKEKSMPSAESDSFGNGKVSVYGMMKSMW